MSIEAKLPDGHPLESASEDDRKWFDAHPDRILRLRHATDGDPVGRGPGNVVFVFCPVTGIRMRPGFTMIPEMRDTLMAADTDAALAPYFAIYLDELVKAQGDGPPQDGVLPARRMRKLFNIALAHGRLAKLPSVDVLDAA